MQRLQRIHSEEYDNTDSVHSICKAFLYNSFFLQFCLMNKKMPAFFDKAQ